MNFGIKNIRLLHTSLNHKRKQHIFKIFKKDEVNSPFEFKEEEGENKMAQNQEKLQNAKEVLQSYEMQNKIREKERQRSKLQTISEEQTVRDTSIDNSNNTQQSQNENLNKSNNDDNSSLGTEGKLNPERSKTEISSDAFVSHDSTLQIQENAQEISLGSLSKNNFQYQKQEIKKSLLPPFQQLDDGLIHSFTMYSKNIQLHSPYRWTPLLQNQDVQDREFQLKMKQFRKKKLFEANDEAELIDTFLFQALKNTGFDYYYDYICQPSKSCPFHGRIDFLIYHRDADSKVPFVPILRARKEKNSLGEWEDKFNQAELLGAALWALTNMKARDPSISVCRAIHTNGNQWRMIQINDKGEFEKTHIYTPEKDEYHKIYRDEDAQGVALGLIKFALNQPGENEAALKKVYDFVDERKYLTDLDDDTKAKLDKIHKTYFFLPKFVRDFFFGYK